MLFSGQYKYLLITLGIIMVLSFLAGYFGLFDYEDAAYRKPQIDALQSNEFTGDDFQEMEEGEKIEHVQAYREVEANVYYTVCEHVKPLNFEDTFMSEEELKKEFKEDDDWTVKDSGESIILTKKEDSLCPSCEKHRHLGTFGEFVAVIKGPVGVDGGVVEVTDIKISMLPQKWQKQIKKGELDFQSAEKLLEALDSMDEYERD